SEQADGAEPAPAAPDATAALKPGALELPAAETGIVPVGERAIASTAEAEAATEDEPAGALAPATGAGPLEAGVQTAAMAPRSASATGNPRAQAARAEARGAEPGDATRTDTAKSPKTVAAPAKGPSDKKTSATEKAAAPSTAQARPPRSKVPFIVGALIALIAVGGVAAAGTYMAEMWGGKTVPSVVGLPQAEAEAALADKGFAAAVTEEKSDEAPGTVLAAAPDGGRAEEGSTVELTVAVARTVPAVAGLTQQEAVDLLAAEGLSSVEVTEEKSNEAAGTVLAVTPEAGTALLSTDTVTLTVAVPFTVPDVAGSSRDDAVAALEAEGYEADVQRYYTEDAEEGTAVSTDPEAGTELNSGSTVTLYIAKSRAAELRELTTGVLPGATLTTEEGTYLVKEVKSTSYKGDGEVSYTVVAVKSEVVKFPFGLGEKTYYDDKNPVTLEGGLVWNDNDKISYANPEITLP
ncbi:PASTA domain-containing protein, partial [Adlercreutzia muris]